MKAKLILAWHPWLPLCAEGRRDRPCSSYPPEYEEAGVISLRLLTEVFTSKSRAVRCTLQSPVSFLPMNRFYPPVRQKENFSNRILLTNLCLSALMITAGMTGCSLKVSGDLSLWKSPSPQLIVCIYRHYFSIVKANCLIPLVRIKLTSAMLFFVPLLSVHLGL